MPIYEFTCDRGHVTADLRKMGDNSPMPCPQRHEGEPCGHEARRGGPEGCQFYLRYDASQKVAPKHPGMSGCQNPNRRVPAGTVR